MKQVLGRLLGMLGGGKRAESRKGFLKILHSTALAARSEGKIAPAGLEEGEKRPKDDGRPCLRAVVS